MTLTTSNGALTPQQIIDIKAQLELSTIVGSDTVCLTGNLIGSNQDTNDAARVYSWRANSITAAVSLSEPQKITFKESGNFLVDAYLLVSDAGANERAAFYMKIVHRASDGTVIQKYEKTSTYIRDDVSSYDSGASSGSVDIIANLDDYVTIETVRLDSQDPTGFNPAHQTQSTILVRKREWTLA